MTAAPRTARKPKVLTISATQIENFRLCNRKWWLKSVRKLPEPPRASSTFGTVLHSVCERYLSADETGRDPETGEPVELFPEGWTKAVNRYNGETEGEVSPSEADQIKKLIEAAIENGVLERLPDRTIEQEFRYQVIEFDEHRVDIVGFIDIAYPDAVDDHKTSKSTRYFKSKAKLKENPQMLIYAKMVLEHARERGGAVPSRITLRHRQYCKDPSNPVVRKTEVTVSPADIDREWAQVEADAKRMVQLSVSANKWNDINDPPSGADACNAYGGCPYRRICGGVETEEQYARRLDNLKKQADNQSDTLQLLKNIKGKHTMSSTFQSAMSRIKGRKSGATPAAASANPPASKAEKKQAQTAKAPAETPQKPQSSAPAQTAPAGTDELCPPPWANESCVACGGSGFNSHGKPCRICDMKASAENKSNQFSMEPTGDGTVVWQHIQKPEVYGESPLPGERPEAEAEERVESSAEEATEEAAEATEQAPAPSAVPSSDPVPPPTSKKQAKPSKVEEPEEEEEEESGDDGEEEVKATKAGPGRPRKGFVLCINVMPHKSTGRRGSGRGIWYLHEVLDEIGAQMLEQFNAEVPKNQQRESFWDLDVWARRDYMMKFGEQIAKQFRTDFVVASGVGTGHSDIKALLDAIRPYAGMEIIPDAF